MNPTWELPMELLGKPAALADPVGLVGPADRNCKACFPRCLPAAHMRDTQHEYPCEVGQHPVCAERCLSKDLCFSRIQVFMSHRDIENKNEESTVQRAEVRL